MNTLKQKIVGLIVHKLIKERHTRDAEVVTREAVVEVSVAAERLVSELHRLYAEKHSKGYGKFEADEDNYPMPRYLREYFERETIDFRELSLRMMGTLRDRIQTEQLATGGNVLIAHVNNGATDFILVAIVTDKIGTAITDGLDIVDSTHVDISALRVAGRVDATAWLAGGDRYLSFLKQRGDVSDYFKHFLGCDDFVEAAVETRKLIKCLRSFATDAGLDSTARDRMMRDAYDYCMERSKANQPLSLDGLANRLLPDAPDVLKAAFVADDIQLSDGFIPDRQPLKSLVRFKGKTPAWAVEFERDGLQTGDIEFDPDTQSLILHNLPDDLLREMIAERRDEPEEV